ADRGTYAVRVTGFIQQAAKCPFELPVGLRERVGIRKRRHRDAQLLLNDRLGKGYFSLDRLPGKTVKLRMAHGMRSERDPMRVKRTDFAPCKTILPFKPPDHFADVIRCQVYGGCESIVGEYWERI